MKKSIWIFLLAVLLPGIVLGWLALRSAEEQQIIFERRTAELYQKETEDLAAQARKLIEGERRNFGDTVHRLLARSDAEALARDFPNSLMDAWPRKAVGFVLGNDGQLVSPTTTMAAKNQDWRDFLWNNGPFLCSTQPAVVYPVPLETGGKGVSYSQARTRTASQAPEGRPALTMSRANEPVLAQKAGTAQDQSRQVVRKEMLPPLAPSPDTTPTSRGAAQAKADLATPPAPAAPPMPSPTRTAPPPSPSAPIAAQGAPAAEPMDAVPPPAQALAAPRARLDSAKAKAPADEASLTRRGAGGGAGSERRTSAPAAASAPKPAALAGRAEGGVRTQDSVSNAAEMGRFGAAPRSSEIPPEKDGFERAKSAAGVPMATEEKQAQGGAFQEQESIGAVQEAVEPGQIAGLQKRGVVVDQQVESNERSLGGLAGAQQWEQNVYANRMVEPQQQINTVTSNWSAVLPAKAEFRALTAESDEGMLARFVQDKLDLVFWIRPPEAPDMVFGCLIHAQELEPLWKELFASRIAEEKGERSPYVLALLDDRTKPVAIYPAVARTREWKRPFVATEIGEMLPHWEAALYLATPTAVADTARGLRRTLSFTIVGAIALIALGGWLVVADVRRQLALAQQKTDFVSNVSHELKTPLTSIRMFAELMHDRPPPAEKQGQYLRIITVEAERLTRLINNVLDFAKLERRQKRFDKRPLDLHTVIGRVWEGQEMHLRDAGFTTRWEAASGPYPVLGDEDALAQILVNLISNAEKYSQEQKDVEIVTWRENGRVYVSVLDRGMGVPEGEERKIFEAFYRAHDSLSSGIQGSGLGLTLAQRLAREHGGEIVYERRKDGGSRFTLSLPLVPESDGKQLDGPVDLTSA